MTVDEQRYEILQWLFVAWDFIRGHFDRDRPVVSMYATASN